MANIIRRHEGTQPAPITTRGWDPFDIMRETGILGVSCPEMLEGVSMDQNKWHAYDVWTLGGAGRPISVIFYEVFPPNPVADGGIPD